MTTTGTIWRNFASTRTPCPGCEAAGYADSKGNPSHALCRERQAGGGRVIQCRKLQRDSEPDGWRVFGEGAQGTTAFFIPDGTPRAESHRRRPVARRPSPKPDPKVAPDAVLDLVYSQVRTLCGKYAMANRGATEMFFEDRGAAWDDPKLYSVMPTKSEERELLNRISLDGLDDYQVPGLNLRGRGRWFIRAKADPEAAYIEWVLGPDGGIRGMRYRFLAPTDTKTKLHGKHRVHHPVDWGDLAPREMFIIEGVRKANEAQRLTGAACLGLPGVAVGHGVLLEVLAAVWRAKPQTIVMAPDFLDLKNGERSDDVRRAVFGVWRWLGRRITAACGAEVRWATWDTDDGRKGIDDALVAGEDLERVDLEDYLGTWTWRGDAPETWDRSRVDPFPHSTDAPVTTIEKAVERVETIARSWEPGSKSLAVSSFPGTGKTTAFAMEAIRRLDRGELGCAVLALPERALVQEKLERLKKLAANEGIRVPIFPALGASGTEGEPFHCMEFSRRQNRAKLGRWSCEGCPTTSHDVCKSESGRFRFDDHKVKAQLTAASSMTPVFCITTQAKLFHLARTSLRGDAAIIIDDVSDPGFGMVKVDVHKLEDVDTAATAAESYVVSANLGVAFHAFQKDPTKIPDVLIAQLAADVLAAVHDANDVTVAAAIDKYYYPEVLDVIASDALTRPWDGWGWERNRDADGLLPHLMGLIIEIVRAHVASTRCTISKSQDKVTIVVPQPGLLNRARRGNLVWLSAGRMPKAIATSLDVRREHVDADPQQLLTVAVSDRLFGVHDEAHVQEVVEAVRKKANAGDLLYAGHRFFRFGAVLRKKDRNALADDAGVLHYGRGHASTDKLMSDTSSGRRARSRRVSIRARAATRGSSRTATCSSAARGICPWARWSRTRSVVRSRDFRRASRSRSWTSPGRTTGWPLPRG